MNEVEAMLKKLQELGLEDTKQIAQGVRDHLEELEEIAAYDQAKSGHEEVESLDAVLARHSPPKTS